MGATVLILLIIVFMWVMYNGSEKAKKWSLVAGVVVGALMFYYNFMDKRPAGEPKEGVLAQVEGMVDDALTLDKSQKVKTDGGLYA